MIVNSGLAIVTNRMRSLGTEPRWVHWGTGVTAPIGADTGLQTPAPEARVEGVSSQQTTTATNDTFRVVATLVATAPISITEAGLFDASTAGNLFFRGTFPVLTLGVGDSVQFIFNTQMAR